MTPRAKHLDILVTWMHEQYSRQRFVTIRATSTNQKADRNTKPHYVLLELHNYYIALRGFHFKKMGIVNVNHVFYSNP